MLRAMATMRTIRSGLCMAAAGMLLAGGCSSDRRIIVTSDPPGARVWVNDIEIGTTPAETSFKFYGRYDIRLEKPGYEPLNEAKTARAPVHEWPVIDLVALAAPHRFKDRVEWHFELAPSLEVTQGEEEFREGVLERARETRTELGPRPGR